MEKRYQIFISSTFIDLKEERKAIIEELLSANYIPAGMEMFSASNSDQFKIIKKIIDNCDYYILIVGARYGTIDPTTGLSFTEQEYDYAISKEIPVLAFIHDDPDNLPADKREDDKKDHLEEFRSKVSKGRLCKQWNIPSKLVSAVIISLFKEMNENPQPGWTRGNLYDTTDLLGKIYELNLKKEKLESEVSKLNVIVQASYNKEENIANGNETYKITGRKIVSRNMGRAVYDTDEIELKWDEIFSAVGPYLLSFKQYSQFMDDLRTGINSAYEKSFSSLNDNCVQTIKIQLSALGLTEEKPGIIELIGLTQKGKNYLIHIKTIKNKALK